ncbi:MAG: carbohydrate kinase family protein [Candidatus Gastranaerophilales bacterium]|nr:carbohydrate kinase family protein [Candidatus Gastranaerophilales bacterium]
MFDIITIGSATLDAFIETDEASIVSVSSINSKKEFMSYPYGAKVDIDKCDFQTGGGGLNTAANFAFLGFKTTTIVKIGDELQGQNIIKTLSKFGIDQSNIIKSKIYQTGFSIILTSFQGDRTVLAHRGANSHLEISDINFEAIKNSKWLYLAPLNGNSTKILDEVADFAESHGVNLAINLGTSSIKQGKENLMKTLKTAEVIILNKEEASLLTGLDVRPDTKNEKFSSEIIHPDIIRMLKEISSEKSKITIITDGKNGVYAYDGYKFYHCSEFPAKVVSTLGAGDAFSSTFVASLEKTNSNIELALKYASVAAASVVENFGAQGGFISFEEIENRLKLHPEFEVTIISECLQS